MMFSFFENLNYLAEQMWLIPLVFDNDIPTATFYIIYE